MTKPSLRMLFCAWLGAAGAAVAAEPRLEPRFDRLSCGDTVVTAQASCHGATAMCARETLSFRRTEGSLIVAPHKHLFSHTLPDGRHVEALDYRISRWSCLAGVNGGEYLAILLTKAGGGNCGECEYFRLYHPNGRLIASTLLFDARGRPSEDVRAAALIGRMIGPLTTQALQPVYPR